MTARPTFAAWLRRQRNRPDAVGDLACDVFADPLRPRPLRPRQLLNHMRMQHACREAVEAWKQAVREYAKLGAA